MESKALSVRRIVMICLTALFAAAYILTGILLRITCYAAGIILANSLLVLRRRGSPRRRDTM